MSWWHLRVDEQGVVTIPGMDLGGKATLESIGAGGDIVTFRVAGHKAWAGRGRPREWVPAQIVSCTIKRWATGYAVLGEMVWTSTRPVDRGPATLRVWDTRVGYVTRGRT